jgi:uncharacterized lipoprotein YajG
MKLVLAILFLLTGCTIERQTFSWVGADGQTHSLTASRRTFAVAVSVAGSKSEWQTSEALYVASLSNVTLRADADLIKAVVEGVVIGLKSGL